jgi:hypothetical protein
MNVSNVLLSMPINASPFDLLVYRNYSDENAMMFKENSISKFKFTFTDEDDVQFIQMPESSFTLKIETYSINDKKNSESNDLMAEMVKYLKLMFIGNNLNK